LKYIKYFLYLILGLFLLFILIGIIKPTVEYGHEITVNKSMKEAWAVAQDESKFSQWLEGFKSIELISGIQGEVGSKYRVVVDPGEGQEDFEMVETLEVKEEYELLEMSYDSEMMLFYQKITQSENGGKTTIKTASSVTGKGIMMRSMFACMGIFANSFQKQEEKNIEALKKVIEENTTDYYPVPEPSEEVSENIEDSQ